MKIFYMKIITKNNYMLINQSPEYYKKLLLLDKIKQNMLLREKQYIFNQGYCWNILFNDKDATTLCYEYSSFIGKRFPEGEKYILKNLNIALNYYHKNLSHKRWPELESIIDISITAYYYCYELYHIHNYYNILNDIDDSLKMVLFSQWNYTIRIIKTVLYGNRYYDYENYLLKQDNNNRLLGYYEDALNPQSRISFRNYLNSLNSTCNKNLYRL